MRRTIQAMLLAVLFAGSGLLTFQIYYWVSKATRAENQLGLQLLVGLPFALSCSLRLMRERKWVVAAVALDCVVWVIAYRIGLAAGDMNGYAGMALAGCVGALGVTAATGLGERTLYSTNTLAGAAAIGALTGMPFGFVYHRGAQENLVVALCFPLWQIAVGLWIWSARVRTAQPPGRS